MTGEYIEITITPTWKRWGSKDRWTRGSEDATSFKSLKDAKAFLKDRYGKARRQPMYCDRKDGTTMRTGWVIHYSEYDYDDRHKKIRLARQDWVLIRHCIYDYPFKQGVKA